MRKQLFCVIAVAAFLSLPLAASAENGNGVEDLTVTERGQIVRFDPTTGNGTRTATWVAAGAIEDTGTVIDVFHIEPGRDGCGTLTGTPTFTSSDGTSTFVLMATVEVCPFPPTTVPSSANGRWTVVSGTGRFASIRGRGELFSTVLFSTGEVTLARTGKVSTGG